MNSRRLIILVVAIAAVAAGTWTSYHIVSPPPVPKMATVLPAPVELPEFSLLDQDGHSVGRDVFKGQWDLVFFGFTHCPDICPMTLQVLASARRQLDEAGQDPLPRIVLVSVDPERDTPEAMRQYVDYFGEGNLGITGDLDEIRKLTDSLGIFFAKVPREDGDYTVDHSAVVLLVNPRGEFHALFGAPHSAGNYVHDLPIIMAGS
jgi:protein SCO1/2